MSLKQGKGGSLIKNLKSLTKSRGYRCLKILAKDDTKRLTTTKIKLKRWCEHFEKVTNVNILVNHSALSHLPQFLPPSDSLLYPMTEPLTNEELCFALKQCKKNSSTGIDGISTELLLLGADETVRWLKLIADQIWVEEKIFSDWTKQITVPIFKKGSRLKCDNFCVSSLLCSAYKVFARAMLNRMKHYVEEQLSESRCGFCAKRGCCDQLFSTKILMQRAKEFNVPVFLCFIDRSLT